MSKLRGQIVHKAVRRTAILVDGGFYRRRAQYHWGDKTGEERANELFEYCMRLLHDKHEQRELYRIFYYDCPPMDKKLYHPLLKKQVDFGRTELFTWTRQFFSALKAKRKVALRFGMLADAQAHYTIRQDVIKKLCNRSVDFADLTEDDFVLKVEQKGVDMKIGIDIASKPPLKTNYTNTLMVFYTEQEEETRSIYKLGTNTS